MRQLSVIRYSYTLLWEYMVILNFYKILYFFLTMLSKSLFDILSPEIYHSLIVRENLIKRGTSIATVAVNVLINVFSLKETRAQQSTKHDKINVSSNNSTRVSVCLNRGQAMWIEKRGTRRNTSLRSRNRSRIVGNRRENSIASVRTRIEDR